MNKNGFTLLELLAVIVILAIIALIATPTILNVVNDAQRDAAKDKAWGVMKAVENAYMEEQASTGQTVALPFDVTFEGGKASVGESEVKFSGEKPAGGSVIMHKNGKTSCCHLQFGDYYCTSKDGVEMTCGTEADEANTAECANKEDEI